MQTVGKSRSPKHNLTQGQLTLTSTITSKYSLPPRPNDRNRTRSDSRRTCLDGISPPHTHTSLVAFPPSLFAALAFRGSFHHRLSYSVSLCACPSTFGSHHHVALSHAFNLLIECRSLTLLWAETMPRSINFRAPNREALHGNMRGS